MHDSKLYNLSLFLAVLIVAALCTGCQGPGMSTVPSAPLVAATDAGGQVTAYLSNAEIIAKQIKSHSDPIGMAFSDILGATLDRGLTSAQSEKQDLVAVTADNQQMRDAQKAAEAKEAAVKATVGYRFEMWAIQVAWWLGSILFILVVAHVVFAVLSIAVVVANPPLSKTFGLVAKIANPWGWLTWLVSHVQQGEAVKTAAANAPMLVINNATPAAK